MNVDVVTAQEYHRLIKELAYRIHKSGWHFDAIVCLARGGLQVGDALSRIFKAPLGILFASSYGGEGEKNQGRLEISESICSAKPLPGGRWLLVDDLVDTGVTLVEVTEVLSALRPDVRAVRTAVIWWKESSLFSPDYWALKKSDDAWIQQPFEIFDEISGEECAILD